MAMTHKFGGGFENCGVCATIFGIGCGTVTPWNGYFKSFAGVEKLITGFVEKYLENVEKL